MLGTYAGGRWLIIVDTFLWSAGLWLLWVIIDRLSGLPGLGASRLGTPIAVYALIPLLVSLGLKQGYLPRTDAGELFSKRARAPFSRRCLDKSAAAGQPGIEAFVRSCAARYGLDPLLVLAVVSVESDFNPRALSPRGATGLMQLMPDTARDLGIRDSYDTHTNIEGGMLYLRMMLDRHNAKLPLALASYNAGPAKVVRYKGVPPYDETKEYVRKVTERYQQLKLAQKKSLTKK